MVAAPSPASRHVPERTCVACRRKRPQAEFVRVTRTESGWRVLPGARRGRGAYVCADSPACWEEKRLRRLFRSDAAALSPRLQALNPRALNPAMDNTPTDQPMTT